MFHCLIQGIVETLFPSLSFFCVGIFLLGDNQRQRQASPLGWGSRVLLGTDECFPILLPTPIFLWGDGNMEIDSWAFPSNSSGDALRVVGSKQGQTDMPSHKSVLAMSNVWKVVYTPRNNISVAKSEVWNHSVIDPGSHLGAYVCIRDLMWNSIRSALELKTNWIWFKGGSKRRMAWCSS